VTGTIKNDAGTPKEMLGTVKNVAETHKAVLDTVENLVSTYKDFIGLVTPPEIDTLTVIGVGY